VLPISQKSRFWRRTVLLCAGVFLSVAVWRSAFAQRADQVPYDAVGVIEGDAIVVTGPVNMEMVHGQVKTMLRSGSDVRVKSGSAKIDLVDGGQIRICGPAHFSVLSSGNSLTVALEEGMVHAHIERGPALTIYTAQIQARTITIGEGAQDVVAGIESEGEMCLRANRGAIRVEQQLTGQSVIVPQLGDVQILNGQIEGMQSGAGHCACEIEDAKAAPEQPAPITLPAVAAAMAAPPAAENAPASDQPIYQVIMPPLVYDAKTKAHTALDPQVIVLVRKVRVRSTVIFRGRVVGEVVTQPAPAQPAAVTSEPLQSAGAGTKTVSAAAKPAAGDAVARPAAPANNSLTDRVKSFVRKLWSR